MLNKLKVKLGKEKETVQFLKTNQKRLVKVVKSRHNRLIARNVDSYITFDVLEKFMVSHYLIASMSINHYMRGKVSKKRQILIVLMRLFSLLNAIRYLSSALVDNNMVSIVLMADPHYLLGLHRFNSFILGSAIIIANILIGGVHIILEAKGKLTLLSFLHQIQVKTDKSYRLNRYYYRKYCLKKNFLTKYALNSLMFIPTVVLNGIYFYMLSIIAFFDPDKNFSIWSTLFWNICTTVWLFDLYSLQVGGVSYYYLSTLYLKYQFRQLDEEIKNSIDKKNITELLKAIRAHNTVCVSTHKLNFMFKYLLFILYFFAKIPLNGLLYVSQSADTHMSARILMVLFLLVIITTIFVVNLVSTAVNKWAHNSYKRLFVLFLGTGSPVSSKFLWGYGRFKVHNFIERLSGPQIGFYCLDMFAVNNYKFFDYIIGWITNYLLIIDLISKMERDA